MAQAFTEKRLWEKYQLLSEEHLLLFGVNAILVVRQLMEVCSNHLLRCVVLST